MGGATYYYTVSELIEQGSSIYGENVRVNGEVAPGSVEQEPSSFILRFTMIDVSGEESLPVVYQGVVPDTFKVGNEVVVEGYLDSGGMFQANSLVTKCPSKYVPKK
jgi:cytochrome c-type biogenesis protein CcmE